MVHRTSLARWYLPLVSFSALFFEITLARLLAYTYPSQLTSIVVSLALLGLGFGSFIGLRYFSDIDVEKLIFWDMALLGLSFPLAYAALLLSGNLILLVLCALAPFLCCGVLLSRCYGDFEASAAHRAYFLDVLGGAAACFIVIPLLNTLGAVCLCFCLSGICFMAVVYCRHKVNASIWNFVAGTVGILCVALAVLIYLRRIDDHMPQARAAADKPLHVSIRNEGGRVIDYGWSAIGRADLYEAPFSKNAKWIYNDGVNPTIFIRNPSTAAQMEFLKKLFVNLPFSVRQAQQVLLIGPGGGLEVQLAKLSGAQAVTAVEINPATVDLVNKWKDFSGPLYEQPGVQLYVQEGRRFLVSHPQRYDLIQMSLVFTDTVQAGTYDFVENYLYTKEAHRLYQSRLAPQGMLAMLDDAKERQVRQFITALAVLKEKGLSTQEAMQHMAVIYAPKERFAAYRYLLLVSPSVLPPQTIRAIVNLSAANGFLPLWVPGLVSQEPYAEIAREGEAAFLDKQRLNLSPCLDDWPFFFNFTKSARGYWVLVRPNVWISLLALLVAVFSIIGASRRKAFIGWKPSLLALLMGLSFILMEIGLIQKLTPVVGDPARIFSLMLFSILLWSSIGSQISVLWKADVRALCIQAGLVGAITVMWLNYTAPLYYAESYTLCLLMVFLSLCPIGLCLGMPFPSLLRNYGTDRRSLGFLWGINSLGSVIGAAIAISSSALVGIRATLLLACASYVFSGVIVWSLGIAATVA